MLRILKEISGRRKTKPLKNERKLTNLSLILAAQRGHAPEKENAKRKIFAKALDGQRYLCPAQIGYA